MSWAARGERIETGEGEACGVSGCRQTAESHEVVVVGKSNGASWTVSVPTHWRGRWSWWMDHGASGRCYYPTAEKAMEMGERRLAAIREQGRPVELRLEHAVKRELGLV